VSGVDDTLAVWNLVDAIHKNGAFAGKLVYHVAIVHNLFADVDGRAEGVKGDADDVDSADHAGAKAAGLE
jgi:hypothetical protein